MLQTTIPFPGAKPAWSIYLAFEEGEYNYGGSTEPVETSTRPQVRTILADANNGMQRARRESFS